MGATFQILKLKRKFSYCSSLELIFHAVILSVCAVSVRSSNNPYQHTEILGPEANYTLEWTVDLSTKTIWFNVSAQCKGYVGMGLSKSGTIGPGTDFVIGGVDSTGKPYFSDMHGIQNGTLERDFRQDWKFISAHKGDNRTYLSFSRSFETCDEEDYAINSDLVHLIWAYGDTDEVNLFSPHHGVYKVYLLDPDGSDDVALKIYNQVGPHSNTLLMQRWRAMTRQKLSPRTSSQICTIIRGPSLGYRHYILGGGTYLPHKAERHVRHIVLSRCSSPAGTDAGSFFEPFVKAGGEECYFQDKPTLPKHLCTERVYVAGASARPFYFPEGVGVPIGFSPNEFYMLEVHYHNPANLGDLEVKAGLELMFHPVLRSQKFGRKWRYVAGILPVNYGTYGLFTIPPRSATFNIYAHCSPECTKTIFPVDGIRVFAVLLQMRGSGKAIRLRHFRNKAELPWILNDGNYDSSFQQVRLLSEEVAILPGDQITIQCTYDTSGTNATKLSGFGDDDEQCQAYLLVDQPVPSAWCSSEYSADVQLKRFGVNNLIWNNINQKRIVTSASPKSFVGELLSDIADKNYRWSPTVRVALQQEMQHGQQAASCPLNTDIAKLIPTESFSSNKNDKKKASLALSTPFSNSTVQFPSTSSEYKSPTECQAVVAAIITTTDYGYGYRNSLRSSNRTRAFPTVTPFPTPVSTTPTTRKTTKPPADDTISSRLSRINFIRRTNDTEAKARVKTLLLKLQSLN